MLWNHEDVVQEKDDDSDSMADVEEDLRLLEADLVPPSTTHVVLNKAAYVKNQQRQTTLTEALLGLQTETTLNVGPKTKQKVVDKKKCRLEATLRTARNFLHHNDYKAALATLQGAETTEARLLAADAALRCDPHKTRALANAILADDPTHVPALFRRGLASILLGEPDLAKADLHRCDQHDPAVQKALAKVASLDRRRQ